MPSRARSHRLCSAHARACRRAARRAGRHRCAGNAAATQTIEQLTAGGLSNTQALASINRMIDPQACTMAVTDLFYVSALLFFVLFLVRIGAVWLARPRPGAAAGGGGAH